MNFQRDQPWAWKSVIGSFFVYSVSKSIELSYSIVFKEVRSFYGVNSTIASSLYSFITGFRFLLSPVAVMMIKLFGCDKVAIFGGGLVSIGLFIAACSPNMTLFLLGYGVLEGIGISFCYTCAMVILSENFNERKSLAFGIATCGVSVGFVIFPHIFANIVLHYDFRSALMLLSGFSMNLIAGGLLFKRPDYIIAQYRKECLLKDENRISKSSRIQNIGQILKESTFNTKPFKNTYFVIYTIGVGWFFMGNHPWTIYIVDVIRSTDEVNLNFVMLTFTLEGFAQISGRLLSGYLLDKARLRKYRGIILSVCCFLSGLTYLSLVTIPLTIYSYLLISLIRGFFLAIYFAQHIVMLSDICDAHILAMSIGIVSFLKGIGCLIGPMFTGIIRDNSTWYLETFAFLFINQWLSGGVTLFVFVRKIINDKK